MKLRRCGSCGSRMLASCRQCGDGNFPGNGGVPIGENGPVGGTYPGRGTGGGRNPWRPQPQGTWLVIRYDAADVGIRPIPSGDVFWTSPDIWITGGDADGNPVSGQPCQIHARVWNLGTLPALPTSVSFSYIEPFLAIPITIPQPIATTGVLVPPMGYVVATVPWTPPLVNGNAHSCIIVTCACAFSGDAPSLPGNVLADRHTAQRNLTIVAGAQTEEFRFTVHVANLRPYAATVNLGAKALWVEVPRDAEGEDAQLRLDIPSLQTAIAMLERPASTPYYRLAARRAAMVEESTRAIGHSFLSDDQVKHAVRLDQVRRGEPLRGGAVMPSRNRVNVASPAIALGEPLQLDALQRATASFTLTRPAGSSRAQWFVAHLMQMTDGAIDGGYAVAFSNDT